MNSAEWNSYVNRLVFVKVIEKITEARCLEHTVLFYALADSKKKSENTIK